MWLLWFATAYAAAFAVLLVADALPVIRPHRPTPTRTRRTPEER